MAPRVQVGVPPDTFVSAEPSIAGRAPVNCDAGRLVKLAPEPLKVVALAVPVIVTPVPSVSSFFDPAPYSSTY